MKKFIKENWFKVIIVIALLVGGYFGVSMLVKNNESRTQLASQEKCNQDGLKYFNDYKNKTANYNIVEPLISYSQEPASDNNPLHLYAHELYKFDNPVNHFNKKLNTCLISIHYEGTSHAHWNGYKLESVFDDFHAEIDDVYSNKVLITNNFNEDKAFQQQEDALMSE
jgi:hypothetical protein